MKNDVKVKNYGPALTKDIQTPPSLQKDSDFYERYGKCWIEWKTKYFCCDFYFSSYRENSVKIGVIWVQKWPYLEKVEIGKFGNIDFSFDSVAYGSFT